MTTRYLNWKGPQGRETIDELSKEDFPTSKDFVAEQRRLLSEYALAGMSAYWSYRPCKNWR